MIYDIKVIVADWKKAGDVKYVKGQTCNDNDVCDVCRERTGKELLLDEIKSLFPAHESCRCWISPFVSIELLNKRSRDRWNDEDFYD